MMKTIEHVEAGQNIKASTINSLIDAILGDSYSGVGHYRTTTSGVAIEPGIPLTYADLGIGPDAWKVDPMTLKVTNAWFTIGDKSYGACLTRYEETIDGKDTIDYFHLIDFGKTAIENGEFQGDYYIRVSNTFVDDPESTQTQEDDDEELFNDFYNDNVDEENKVNHYYQIQVVKDARKNGDESSLEDDHDINPEDCVYFKFFTIYGPHDGEKDEEGNQAKTLPPYDIHYYTRSFGGGFGQESLKPFKLRWMPQDDDDQSKGEWQIYLPMGCATLNEKDVYFPKNDIGKDADDEVTFQWYKIEEPQDSDATITSVGTKVFKEWTVYVHFKDFPMMYASTKEQDSDFQNCPDRIAVGTLMQREWTPEGEEKQYQHKTQQSRFNAYNREFPNDGSFQIIFKCDGDRKEEDSYKILLTNQFINFGLRAQAWIEDETDITNMDDVVLDIDHSTEDISISITDTWEENTIDHTYVRLLKLEDKSIKTDNRSYARKEWPFYAN